MEGHKLRMRFKLSYEDREDVVVHTELLTNQFVDYKNYDIDDLLDIVPHAEENLNGITTEWVLREEAKDPRSEIDPRISPETI